MNLQQRKDLLGFLKKAKKDKPFNKIHGRDIKLYISILEANINSESNDQAQPVKTKKGLKDYAIYIVDIIRLVTAFLNSS
jgi:hypothetical protein